MPYTAETTQPIIERLRKRFHHANETTIVSIHLFLTGAQTSVPVLNTPDETAMAGYFIPLLQLPDQWNDNDRLVLQLLSDPQVWEQNEHDFLTHIVPMLDMPGSSSSIVQRFSTFTHFLQQQGYSPEKIGSMLIRYSNYGENMDLLPLKFSPLRKFLQDLLRSTDAHAIQPYLQRWYQLNWNSLFFRLLAKSHPDLELPYLEKKLSGPVPGYLNSDLANALLQNNFAKYEPLLLQTGNPAAAPVAMQLGVQLALTNYQPDTYQANLLPLFRQYLQEFSQAPVATEGYASSILQADTTGNYPLSLIALHGLLQHNAAEGMDYLLQFVREQREIHPACFEILGQRLQQQAVPILMEALEKGYDIKLLLPVMEHVESTQYFEQLWPYTLHKLKSVRMAVAVILAKDPDAYTKAAELLQHKKAEQRLTATLILCSINTPEARQLIRETLHNEINDDARDLMLETLGNLIHYEADMETVNHLIASARSRYKLNRPLEKWMDDQSLPLLWTKDGEQLPLEATRFLLYRMSRITEMGADVEAKPLLKLLDPKRNDDFAMGLFNMYEQHEGDTRLKFLLATAALTGHNKLAAALQANIGSWINERRPRQAEHALAAMALQANSKSLQIVEYYGKKYTTRRVLLGAAARNALVRAAAELDLTFHELGDKAVPDLEFEGRYKPFEMNGDTWKGFVDNNFRIAYLNRKGKRPKTPPTAASRETKKFFKELQKQLPAMAAKQADRLQQFLVNQRSWKAAQWLELFLHNPLMFVFANRLIWAVYDEENQLMTSFRCTEDSRLITISGAAIELPPFASVRLLHPLQMDAQAMQQWKEHLAANNIIPAFEQLDRQVTTLQPEQALQTVMGDFEDIAADMEVMQQHLLSRGWQPQTNEEGVAHTWYKSNDIQQVEARIATYNIYQESGIRCKLGNLYFTRQLTTAQISSAVTAPADVLQLCKVPPVFYSEAVTDIAMSRVKMELV
ncbi:protein of unknown function [Chitinophaga jiangningensis]|uniref:DUF4132 domain-containing protein n=1 Tax=Chitinophaga jiangningensis TaxID=1419482 RepID=A0A1M7KFI0_9BACT|nr:DUF4132 domain-containing protein [Chitinophaga jiangningensis]SHM64067.1 protein of unknown function [Chitinophaga jiangningensis]